MAIVSRTLETRPNRGEEDWNRFDAMKDENIDLSDIPLQDMSKFRPWRELHSEESVKIRERFIADYQALKQKETMYKPVKERFSTGTADDADITQIHADYDSPCALSANEGRPRMNAN
jgi:hypothetical protein